MQGRCWYWGRVVGFKWVHGGTDAQGVPTHDFSTNRNACGPCPQAVVAVQSASSEQYPDPSYAALRAQLAAFHGVDVARIVIAGSASEWIHRMTMHAVRCGAVGMTLPKYHYGDYLHAAMNWQLTQWTRSEHAAHAGLHWACEPSSPLGCAEDVWSQWSAETPINAWRVLDCAYRPLLLDGEPGADDLNHVWQMWTPNKALGMTGVRAAYVIAPLHASASELQTLQSLAPSWVIGAHGVAMLHAWVQAHVQNWLAQSLVQLREWKRSQIFLCQQLGWKVIEGHMANYFVVRWPADWHGERMHVALTALRAQGIKLRDCSSFGLEGHVRLGVLPPASQHALQCAWQAILKK